MRESRAGCRSNLRTAALMASSTRSRQRAADTCLRSRALGWRRGPRPGSGTNRPRRQRRWQSPRWIAHGGSWWSEVDRALRRGHGSCVQLGSARSLARSRSSGTGEILMWRPQIPVCPRPMTIMAARFVVVEDDVHQRQRCCAGLSDHERDTGRRERAATRVRGRAAPAAKQSRCRHPGHRCCPGSRLEALRRRRRSGDQAFVIVLSARGE